MVLKKINTEDDVTIIIKENGLSVGVIQTLEPTDKKEILKGYRVTFNRLKVSNPQIKNISFQIVVQESKKEESLGFFTIDNSTKKCQMFLVGDYTILNKVYLKCLQK